MQTLRIPISQITADQRAQPRTSIVMDKVEEYAVDMLRGDQFPPLIVFCDEKTYWLADGFHRYYAATSAEQAEIECEVRAGGLRDAVLFSCGANAAHGFRRTNEDKRRAVMKLLADSEWAAWSDREIARHCAVDDKFVGKVRKEIKPLEDTADIRSMERRFAHGKTGRETVMTFAPRAQPVSNPKLDGALIAKSLHEIARQLEMMPLPSEAVARFPQDQRYFFPLSKLEEMSKWLAAFTEAWRDAAKARAASG